MRALQRDLHRPRVEGAGARWRRGAGSHFQGRVRAAGRGRTLPRDLEPRLHAVRPVGRRDAHAPAEALGRYRRRARADRGSAAGRGLELPHRPLPPPPQGSRSAGREAVRSRPRWRFLSRPRRPRARGHLPDGRRRLPGQRRSRLRPPPHPPSRRPPRLAPRPARADPLAPHRDRDPRTGRRLPGAPCQGGLHRRPHQGRRRTLPRDGVGRTRPDGRAAQERGHGDQRRRGLQALRHVRLPDRPDPDHRQRSGGVGGPRRIRAVAREPAAPVARGAVVAGHQPRAGDPDGPGG